LARRGSLLPPDRDGRQGSAYPRVGCGHARRLAQRSGDGGRRQDPLPGRHTPARASERSPGGIARRPNRRENCFDTALIAGERGSLKGAAQAMNVKQLFDLSGRVAIISGGGTGLGRQMAESLAEMGANLVLCARKKERCEQAAEELKKLGVKT